MRSKSYTLNYWQRCDTNKRSKYEFVYKLYTIFSYDNHNKQQLFH